MSLRLGTVFRNRWTVTEKLGQGAFGEIFSATDLYSRDRVAIKLEKITESSKGVLKLEVAILKKLQGCPFFAKYFTCGRTEYYNYVVMELLGDNLSELRRRQVSGTFSVPTVVQIGIQMVSAIEVLHEHGYIHRDIKPSNFAVGSRSVTSGHIYLIDFGLARRYKEPDGSLRPSRKTAGFRGTARYASVYSHRSEDLSRRDDFCSLFYVLVEMITGTLPWRRLKDRESIGVMKQKFPLSRLVMNLPQAFTDFAQHIEGLTYSSRPSYDYLRQTLHQVLAHYMVKQGLNDPPPYDWQPGIAANPAYLLYPPKRVVDLPLDSIGSDRDSPPLFSFARVRSNTLTRTLGQTKLSRLNLDDSESGSKTHSNTASNKDSITINEESIPAQNISSNITSPSRDVKLDEGCKDLVRSPSRIQHKRSRNSSRYHWSEVDLIFPASPRSNATSTVETRQKPTTSEYHRDVDFSERNSDAEPVGDVDIFCNSKSDDVELSGRSENDDVISPRKFLGMKESRSLLELEPAFKASSALSVLAPTEACLSRESSALSRDGSFPEIIPHAQNKTQIKTREEPSPVVPPPCSPKKPPPRPSHYSSSQSGGDSCCVIL
ncbi:hypothetical protein RCL1_000451 [Eukaryota sp. TZLM3-RCL]